MGGGGTAKQSGEGMEEGCGRSQGGLLGCHMPQRLIQALTSLIPGPLCYILPISIERLGD